MPHDRGQVEEVEHGRDQTGHQDPTRSIRSELGRLAEPRATFREPRRNGGRLVRRRHQRGPGDDGTDLAGRTPAESCYSRDCVRGDCRRSDPDVDGQRHLGVPRPSGRDVDPRRCAAGQADDDPTGPDQTGVERGRRVSC